MKTEKNGLKFWGLSGYDKQLLGKLYKASRTFNDQTEEQEIWLYPIQGPRTLSMEAKMENDPDYNGTNTHLYGYEA